MRVQRGTRIRGEGKKKKKEKMYSRRAAGYRRLHHFSYLLFHPRERMKGSNFQSRPATRGDASLFSLSFPLVFFSPPLSLSLSRRASSYANEKRGGGRERRVE